MRLNSALFAVLCLLVGLNANAQIVGLEVEEYAVHTGAIPNLTGTKTYRLYAVCQDQTDFVSSVYGLAGSPLLVTTTTTFFQQSFGSANGSTINPAFYAFFPDIEFDSWVTIGRENTTIPGAEISLVQSSSDPWITEFNAGGNIEIDGQFGGSWFNTFSASSVNGFAGPDFKVLLGQFTTSGVLSGYLNIQVFDNGNNQNQLLAVGLPFSSDPNAVFGCTSPSASNYDPAATIDNGTCVFPCTLQVVAVNTVSPTCPAATNGSASVVATGGQGAVSYSLNGGNPLLNQNFNNLGAGTYTLTVTDGEGCQVVQQFTITPPPAITVSLVNKTNVTCNGAGNGTIDATGAGGTGALMYGLTNGVYTQSSPDFSNLTPGTYTIYAQDANGCTGQSLSFNITQPNPIQANITSSSPASCPGVASGQVVALAFGGNGGIQYSLNGVDYQPSGVFQVPPGTYTVTVRDNQNCTKTTNPVTIGFTGVLGCTDNTACNYNAAATCNSGCEYPGCTDVNACNFNPSAACSNGSCEYVSCAGCTDPTACNYDATAT
ncbi:MAG: SprB repeat-containing protein, partial [Flavobacteriales bacterium]|nr:SprB repeat-containing protein [Flavobacteriales bacterium]